MRKKIDKSIQGFHLYLCFFYIICWCCWCCQCFSASVVVLQIWKLFLNGRPVDVVVNAIDIVVAADAITL